MAWVAKNMEKTIELSFSFKVESLNITMRQNVFARAKKIKHARTLARTKVEAALKVLPLEAPYKITLIRYGKKVLDKEENLTGGSFKAIKDGVSDALGYKDDSHPDLTWDFDDKVNASYKVKIIITEKRKKKEENDECLD